MIPILQIEGVSKHYPGADSPVLDAISLGMNDRQFLALLGSSGCGKSTLLRMLAGFERPDTGHVRFRGHAVSSPLPGVGYMPQSYDLFPWKTVAGNVALGLLQFPLSPADRSARVRALLEEVGLAGSEALYPKQLSGGMRQRIALARTLATEPKILLLDEPFGALDAQNRDANGRLVRAMFESGRVESIVMITHDIEEAVRLADRVVVLAGRPTRIALDSPTSRHDRNAPDLELAQNCRQWLSDAGPRLAAHR